MTAIPVADARGAFRSLPEGTNYGEAPPPDLVYLPPSHRKALDLDRLVVVGMRGAGKTFWWSALQTQAVRDLVDQGDTRRTGWSNIDVHVGFGTKPASGRYPDKDTLLNLIGRGLEPRLLWWTVLARQIASREHPVARCERWSERARFVRENPEEIARLFEERDEEYALRGEHCLVLFDALDRCADDWQTMSRLIRGLLQSVLDLRSYRRLRAKVFLRPDQFSEPGIRSFPDASKLLSSSAELNWPRSELYGLLWHVLANGQQHGKVVREFLGFEDWRPAQLGQMDLFFVPRPLVLDEKKLRDSFHELTGPWMGRDRRRGFPYRWVPGHLGDGAGRVSPRTFLAALRAAAEDTEDRYPDYPLALHYESLKRGVQEASRIRVQEIQEDYPWVHRVLEPLAGMVVPCDFDEIKAKWSQAGGVRRLVEAAARGDVKLPPPHFEDGDEGVRRDLEALNVVQRMRDCRVNMPDVFRVGYGLGRKGGVKSIR